jgi:glycosyltransferase involved in cell wall biosynthesis
LTTDLPKVSILMPIRNEETYLPSALDSITRQTLRDWQLIVVDDGSTDATPDILAKAAREDKRIQVLRRTGGGLVMALNSGLSACTAPLLARMDGDDICHPKRLECQVRFLESNTEVGLVACSFRHFPRSSVKQGMRTYEAWQNSLNSHVSILRDLFVESPFVHPSIMARKSLIIDIGGYRDLGWPEDYDLWLRLAHSNVQFARIPEQLFFWRDHPERATRVMGEYASSAFRLCKLHHLLNGFLENTTEVIIAGAGQEGRAWQRLLSSRGLTVTTWIDVDHRKIGRQLHGSPVVGIDTLPSLAGTKILVAIGVHGAREQFRAMAGPIGFKDGLDFICVA